MLHIPAYSLFHEPLGAAAQRAALMALHEYLARNEYEWTGRPGDDANTVSAVLKQLAAGVVTEKQLTDWISVRIGGLE